MGKKPRWSNAPADWLARLGVLGVLALVVYAVCFPIYLVINDAVSGKLTSQPGKFAGIKTGAWSIGLVFGVLVMVGTVVVIVCADRRETDPKKRLDWSDWRGLLKWTVMIFFMGMLLGVGCAAVIDNGGFGGFRPEDYYRHVPGRGR